MSKVISRIDGNGFFVGSAIALIDQLDPDNFLIPLGCKDIPPIEVPQGKRARLNADGTGFDLEDIPPDPEPETDPPPDIEKLKSNAVAAVKEARKAIFNTLAGIQSEANAKGFAAFVLAGTLGDLTPEKAEAVQQYQDCLATSNAIVALQQAVKGIHNTDLSACTTQADIDAAFLNAWHAIVLLAPANVQSAFNEVLA
jgi:hypothetical protein